MAIVFATYFVSFAHEFRHCTMQFHLLRLDSLATDGHKRQAETVDV